MSQTKTKRDKKRQLGQFYTPSPLARQIVNSLSLTPISTILEPSAGDGAFIIPIIERFMDIHPGTQSERLHKTLSENVFAVEIDLTAHTTLLLKIKERWGELPQSHHLIHGDFFDTDFKTRFDFVVGNPPFGGTIKLQLQDQLDRRYGKRDGLKIKKETYSFFIVQCVEMLKPSAQLQFICSDTFLTIPTMKGLREFLLNRGQVSVTTIKEQFHETVQPMVLLDFKRTGRSDEIIIDERHLHRNTIDLTGNRSWRITDDLQRLFNGPKIEEFMIATGGMTIGNNDLFVRDIIDNTIVEPYEFVFRQEPITLKNEIERARLGQLSELAKAKIIEKEQFGITRRVIDVLPRENPKQIQLPHPDYCFYNKSSGGILFRRPRHAIFWKNDGDAVKTFKKNGNWYLHGVGGQKYFKRAGLTWQLISSTLNMRYLPNGYILDSGSPCAFLKDGIDPNELWFILGWSMTSLCTRILKEVLNHTRNIQSKDFERLPYPFWVPADKKKEAILRCHSIVQLAIQLGKTYNRRDFEVMLLTNCYL